jgi:hypothetical protein
MKSDWVFLMLGLAGIVGGLASGKLPASGKLAVTLLGVALGGLGLSAAFC